MRCEETTELGSDCLSRIVNYSFDFAPKHPHNETHQRGVFVFLTLIASASLS